MELEKVVYSVSDAVALVNQTLEYAFPLLAVEGEVANYKVSGGKWVFFDLKDETMSVKCFAAAWNLRVALEDGMKVVAVTRPRLGKYGFSLNIESVKPVGEGSIKKAFELLKQKLEAEGLFAAERKRPLPTLPAHIGVISSLQAAGYKDFIKILGGRLGGLKIEVANTAVQGDGAADQIIRALEYFNQAAEPPELVAILRGGGSRDDLAVFDDELLVRAIASSRVPTIVGVGHEIDVTLSDLAADVRASTPSNAAEILVPDQREIISRLDNGLASCLARTNNQLEGRLTWLSDNLRQTRRQVEAQLAAEQKHYQQLLNTLKQLNPQTVLKRGYAIVRGADGKVLRGKPQIGQQLAIQTAKTHFSAQVLDFLD